MGGGPAPKPEGGSPWRALEASPGPVYLSAAAEIVRLCDVDLTSQAGAIGGWHGTSLEAIEHALRLGALAPSSVPHGRDQAGYLFYYPADSLDFAPHRDFIEQSNGRGGALYYADGSAAYHYLIKRCGLDFTNEEHHLLAMEAIDCIESGPRARYTRDALSELGIPEKQQRDVMHEAKSRKGFLIAISRTALAKWQPSEGDQAGVDEKIFVPAGLPFGFISAIVPLGPVEKSFVDALRQLSRGGRDG